MFGIEANATIDSRFQRWSLGKQLFPGALPRLRWDSALGTEQKPSQVLPRL